MEISLTDDVTVMTVQVPTGPQVFTVQVPGTPGPAGPANTLTIGTVTTGAAAATITGTAPNQVLNLTIPSGGGGDGTVTVANITDATTIGRNILLAADAAAVRTAIGAIPAFADPNADRIVFWDDSASAFAALTASTGLTISGTNITVATSSATVAGIVELATTAEATTGTDTVRAVTPAGLKTVADTKAALSHTHAIGDLTATGTKDATTFLRGDNTWAVPPGGGGGGTVTVANITDATTVGRNVLLAADAAAVRTVIGAGTSNLALGTTSSTAKAGDYQPTSANIADATDAATGNMVVKRNAGGSASFTQVGIGATAPTDVGHAARKDYVDTQVATKAALSHTHTAANISDSTTVGRSVLTAADAAAARTAIGAGTSSLTLGTSGSTAKAGDYQPAAANISDSTVTGRAVLTATDAATARTAIGAGTSSLAIGTTSTTAKAGDYAPADATTGVKGIVQLANHLGGTATAPTVRSASETQTGIVELATSAETTTGTSTTLAVHPAGVKAVADALDTRIDAIEALDGVLVLGPSDTVPGGTPANTVIFRTV